MDAVAAVVVIVAVVLFYCTLSTVLSSLSGMHVVQIVFCQHLNLVNGPIYVFKYPIQCDDDAIIV